MKRAFITGVTGQDGSCLAEFLLHKGYEVHAILRRSSVFTTVCIDHLYACNGILFNHEPPRRAETFVTKKITKAVANIYHKKQGKLVLGNLNSKCDWGYAKEYVEAMWLMLRQEKPEDFVIATGTKHTICQFV